MRRTFHTGSPYSASLSRYQKVSSRQLSVSCAYELRVFKEPTLQEEVATLAMENKMKVRGIRK